MEWVRRNPKAAVGVSALIVLCAITLVWGISRGSGRPSAEGTLGPSLALPTTTPTRALGPLSPSAQPTSVAAATAGFPSTGMGAPGIAGSGLHNGLPAHHIVISTESDGPLFVGWRMPTADGARGGKDVSGVRTYRHATTVYGNPDYAQLYAYDGPNSSRLSCTITVDGKVTDHQVAKGPWGQVFCQG